MEKYGGLHRYKAIKFVTYVTCTSPQFAWRQKDELKVLGTTKQEFCSTNVYIVFSDQKHKTIVHYVKH